MNNESFDSEKDYEIKDYEDETEEKEKEVEEAQEEEEEAEEEAEEEEEKEEEQEVEKEDEEKEEEKEDEEEEAEQEVEKAEQEEEEEKEDEEEEEEAEEEKEEEEKIIPEYTEEKNTFLYEPIIAGIFGNLPRLNMDKNREYNVKISSREYISYSFKEDRYVWLILQSIIKSTREKTNYEREGLIDIIYQKIQNLYSNKNLQINPKCSLKLTLFTPAQVLIFDKYICSYSNENFILPMEFKNKIPKSFKFFISFISKKIEECSFLAIPIYLASSMSSGHVNIIFMEKYKNRVIANYYEPGGQIEWGGKVHTDILIENMEKSSNYYIKFFLKPSSECSVGIQVLTKRYDIGFCAIYSLFWIYVVLDIFFYNIINNSYIPSPEWIGNVEKYLVNLIRNDRTIYEKILYFTKDLIKNYMENNNPLVIKQNFQNYLEQGNYSYKGPFSISLRQKFFDQDRGFTENKLLENTEERNKYKLSSHSAKKVSICKYDSDCPKRCIKTKYSKLGICN
jgi:flagellar motor protein MotB